MISVNFSPLISSSNTHICTIGAKTSGYPLQFSATTLAIVVPQLPDPITVTLKGFSAAFKETEEELLFLPAFKWPEVKFNLSAAADIFILSIFVFVEGGGCTIYNCFLMSYVGE
ncbi:hypothetical protein WN66_01026 [Saccharomyces cerevisiae]|nr:hypothetical protein WN66_01026 [Saccharomyces cerevisiae]